MQATTITFGLLLCYILLDIHVPLIYNKKECLHLNNVRRTVKKSHTIMEETICTLLTSDLVGRYKMGYIADLPLVLQTILL